MKSLQPETQLSKVAYTPGVKKEIFPTREAAQRGMCLQLRGRKEEWNQLLLQKLMQDPK